MPSRGRLRALDIFRGLTVAGMILVNCSGSDEVYPMLEHAPWNGLTFADFVFPAFLLIVGMSAALSRAARVARGQTPRDIAWHAAGRAAGLFALGFLVNVFLYHGTAGVRWMGVLQRIALCGLGATAFLALDMPEWEPAAVSVLLVGYWLLLTRVPVPGFGAGVLTPQGNLASWLDRLLMGGHMETPLVDPEGLLGTLPALATTLIGLIAGRRLVGSPGDRGTVARLAAAGAALTAAGFVWSVFLPLNKHIWTSSFAVVTAGLCLLGFGLCLLAFPGPRTPRWIAPVESLGRHALAAYVISGLVYGIQEFVPCRLPSHEAGNLKLWLTATLFERSMSPRNASLSYAVLFTALFILLAALADPGRDA